MVELVGYDTDNSTILQEIIDDYDKEIAYALKHNKVAKELYHRYVYQHIFTDTLYKTNENI